MKNATRVLGLVLTLLPLFAAAQLQQSDKLVTNVPFDFMVANKTMPAGEWILQSASDGARTLVLRNIDVKLAFFSGATPENSRKPAGACALVFHKYGDRYFLSAVKIAGSNTMYRIPESKFEAELQARNTVPTETILLASLR